MDFILQFNNIKSILLKSSKSGCKRPFVSDVHIILIRIKYKLLTILIDGIVSEVHTNILHIILIRHNIGFSSKPSQPFPINIDLQWVNWSNQHINSKIKFESINQIGFAQIPLDDTMLFWIDLLELSREEDSFSLTHRLWLYYVGTGFALRLTLVVSTELVVV